MFNLKMFPCVSVYRDFCQHTWKTISSISVCLAWSGNATIVNVYLFTAEVTNSSVASCNWSSNVFAYNKVKWLKKSYHVLADLPSF